MSEIEISTSSMIYCGSNYPDLFQADRRQAETIYRILLELGATKDVKFIWDDESCRIYFKRKFYYKSGQMPTPTDPGDRIGDGIYTLGEYLKVLIRFDRSAWNRMKNIRHKIDKMYTAIETLKKQL